jgi:transcription initiation factor TFIIIB Brf1 subunit/transcription initiation factor TFIIB
MSEQKESALSLRVRGYILKFISRLNLIEEVRAGAIELLEALAQDQDFLSRSNPK